MALANAIRTSWIEQNRLLACRADQNTMLRSIKAFARTLRAPKPKQNKQQDMHACETTITIQTCLIFGPNETNSINTESTENRCKCVFGRIREFDKCELKQKTKKQTIINHSPSKLQKKMKKQKLVRMITAQRNRKDRAKIHHFRLLFCHGDGVQVTLCTFIRSCN
jgi:hypothetical protein